MTAKNFDKSLKRVLAYEGGYSNHPNDPGGPTMKGVTQAVYDGYRRRNGLTLQPVRQVADSEVAAIYRLQYWSEVKGDQLPPGVDFVVFDGAVNSGPSRSVKWLQAALRMNRIDGELGQATLAAVDAHLDHDKLIAEICERRMAFLKALRTWSTFGKGWSSRVNNVRRTGQAWASGSVGPAPVPVHKDGGDAKALESDLPKAPVSVGKTASGAVASGAAAEVTDQLGKVSDAIEPLAATLQIAGYVLTAITVILAGVALYGIYQSYKAERVRTDDIQVEGAA